MSTERKAPLYDALQKAARQDSARFHMPGHKGLPLPGGVWGGLTAFDVTELSYSGNLYTETRGPIRDAEAALARLYGTENALFLTGGASQGILSMLACAAPPGSRVLIHRCAHRSVFHALALLDLHPVYIDSASVAPFYIGGGIDPALLEETLRMAPEISVFVLTSPSYYGVLSNIAALSAVCRRYNVTLLVDAAHGAHIPFTGAAQNPVADGADIAVFSSHKTLPALGQSAFLLCNGRVDTDRIRFFTSVFGTSSPSYPLMASLDLARADLETRGTTRWGETAAFGSYIRSKYSNLLSSSHLSHGVSDPCRLCLCTGDGYTDALALEREHQIFCEMADIYNIVFILTPEDKPEWHTRLDKAIAALPVRDTKPLPPTPPPVIMLSPREAMLSLHETVPLNASCGRIAAAPIAPYPPGVPLVAPGEKIDKTHLVILEKMCYTVDEDIRVVIQRKECQL